MNTINSLKKISLAVLMSSSLIACGGGGGNSVAIDPGTGGGATPVEPVAPEDLTDGIYFRNMGVDERGESTGQVMIIDTEDTKNPVIISTLTSTNGGDEFRNIYLIDLLDATTSVINGEGNKAINFDTSDTPISISDTIITLTEEEATVTVTTDSPLADNLENGAVFVRQPDSPPLSDLVVTDKNDHTITNWTLNADGNFSAYVNGPTVTGTVSSNGKGIYTGSGTLDLGGGNVYEYDARLVGIVDGGNTYLSAILIGQPEYGAYETIWGGLQVND